MWCEFFQFTFRFSFYILYFIQEHWVILAWLFYKSISQSHVWLAAFFLLVNTVGNSAYWIHIDWHRIANNIYEEEIVVQTKLKSRKKSGKKMIHEWTKFQVQVCYNCCQIPFRFYFYYIWKFCTWTSSGLVFKMKRKNVKMFSNAKYIEANRAN